MPEKEKLPEVLFWVGCAGSFDERIQSRNTGFREILNKVGGQLCVLRPEEACTGDPARSRRKRVFIPNAGVCQSKVMNGYEIKKSS